MILATDGNNVDTLRYKGESLYSLGRDTEAITYYDKVLANDPEYPAILSDKGVALMSLGKNEELIATPALV